MFRITAKVRIAAGLVAGALTLGAAAVYATANANNTITVRPTPIALGSGSNLLKLIGFDGTTSLTLPPGGGSVTLSKNYHGKLMSGAASPLGASNGNGHANGHGTRPKPTN